MAPAYEAYPNKKTTPSRLSRKQQRRSTFLKNKEAARKLRKARIVAEEARLAALEENTEE
jgi:hypothetical protein